MSGSNGTYRVQLDTYYGPLDLLLYLIRRDEVDIYDIPISRIAEQYIAYVDVLRTIDPNTAGEFLVMIATLMEVKSRMLLPVPPPEEQEDFVDPRRELVRQLLEYKRFKDAAEALGEAATQRSLRFERRPIVIDEEEGRGAVDIEDVALWDLLAAFNELLAQVGREPATHDVIYDDTPIALHAADLVDRLSRAGGSIEFTSIFSGLTKVEIIGLFLALLELVRQKRIRAEQSQQFEMITIHLLEEADAPDATIEPESGAVEAHSEPAVESETAAVEAPTEPVDDPEPAPTLAEEFDAADDAEHLDHARP